MIRTMNFSEAHQSVCRVANETGKWSAVIETGPDTYEVRTFDEAPTPRQFAELHIVAWEVPS